MTINSFGKFSVIISLDTASLIFQLETNYTYLRPFLLCPIYLLCLFCTFYFFCIFCIIFCIFLASACVFCGDLAFSSLILSFSLCPICWVPYFSNHILLFLNYLILFYWSQFYSVILYLLINFSNILITVIVNCMSRNYNVSVICWSVSFVPNKL